MMTRDDVIFFTFYTPGAPRLEPRLAARLAKLGIGPEDFSYASHVKKLAASMKRFGLHYDIERIPREQWQKMVRSKPAFIHRKMVEFGDKYKAFVWVDADSEFLKDPWELFHLNGDIACRVVSRPRFQPMPRTTEVHMGLLWLANRKVTRKLVKEWVKRMDGIHPQERCPEQEALYDLLIDWRKEVTWIDLPERFAQPVGWGHQFAVSVQFQQSRYEREPEKLKAHLDAIEQIHPHNWKRDPRAQPRPPRTMEETRKLKESSRAKRKAQKEKRGAANG